MVIARADAIGEDGTERTRPNHARWRVGKSRGSRSRRADPNGALSPGIFGSFRGGGGIRTLTWDGLSALPLPIGLRPRAVPFLTATGRRREDWPMSESMQGVDLTDLDTFSQGFPHELFRRHRESAPVWWHAPTTHTPDGEGFWSVATYDEVLHVLHDPVTFSSETGGGRPYGGTIIQDLPVAGIVLNMMDDPRHARIRRLVTKGLTPAAVRGAGGRAAATHAPAARLGRLGVRLPHRGGGGAPDAGHLRPPRSARVRPAPALLRRSSTSSTYPTSPTSSR